MGLLNKLAEGSLRSIAKNTVKKARKVYEQAEYSGVNPLLSVRDALFNLDKVDECELPSGVLELFSSVAGMCIACATSAIPNYRQADRAFVAKAVFTELLLWDSNLANEEEISRALQLLGIGTYARPF